MVRWAELYVRWAELYVPYGDPMVWYPDAQVLAQLYDARLRGHCYSWAELTRLVATGQIVFGIVPSLEMLPPDRDGAITSAVRVNLGFSPCGLTSHVGT